MLLFHNVSHNSLEVNLLHFSFNWLFCFYKWLTHTTYLSKKRVSPEDRTSCTIAPWNLIWRSLYSAYKQNWLYSCVEIWEASKIIQISNLTYLEGLFCCLAFLSTTRDYDSITFLWGARIYFFVLFPFIILFVILMCSHICNRSCVYRNKNNNLVTIYRLH